MSRTAEILRRRVILVTDGEQRASLACVRSLGAAGNRILVASHRRRSIAGTSRFAHKHFTVPPALTDPVGFLDAVTAGGCGAGRVGNGVMQQDVAELVG